jgi:hypothetical protein
MTGHPVPGIDEQLARACKSSHSTRRRAEEDLVTSEDEIKRAVEEELWWATEIHAADIGVAMKDGRVRNGRRTRALELGLATSERDGMPLGPAFVSD